MCHTNNKIPECRYACGAKLNGQVQLLHAVIINMKYTQCHISSLTLLKVNFIVLHSHS
jgi:hypothetical protein